MNDKIIEALKLIITKSPAAMHQAMQAIMAARNNSPVLAARYNQVLSIALANNGDDFTPPERALLAAAIDPGSPAQSKSEIITLRLTPSERLAVQKAADAAGQSISDYIRDRIM